LGKAAPELFGEDITPSQRKASLIFVSLDYKHHSNTIKYFEMINAWGGWNLFQELLQVLSVIAERHSVSVSNVATRWVLDFPYVGAVILGCRMGVSDHAEENLACFGWNLDSVDRKQIEVVLEKSRRGEVFVDMGDCGAEYR